MPSADDFTTSLYPTWCPGCGNFGLWKALRAALQRIGVEKHELAYFWGIGCHGNGADFLDVTGFHALHGRALPAATGFALTNPDMRVVVEMGDGDGYGLGGNHFLHTIRRNLDMTALFHNNQIYGLTTGQASPTSEHLMPTVSTPTGVLEEPVNPTGIALAQGASFVARGFTGDVAHLTDLIVAAIEHPGFAVLDVFQPCVTWNKVNTGAWFKERVYKLHDIHHDTSDRLRALELSMSTFHELTCTPDECRVPIGVFYRDEQPTYQSGLPQLDGPAWKRATGPRDVSKSVAALM